MWKKPQVAAELAVVPLLRLFQEIEMGLHLGFIFEGGAVDALELRVLLVAQVIGAGDVGELERADVAGAHDVGPGAEVDEIAVGVERDLLPLRDALEDIELEPARLRTGAEGGQAALPAQRDRLGPRNGGADEGLVRLGHRLHLRLDPLEVGGGDAVGQVDVVIETVLDRRTGRQLGLGPDFQKGGRQDMGGGMAEAFDIGHAEGG